MANNYQQKKKKKGSLWGVVIVLAIWAINRLDPDKIRRFFSRMSWMIRTGRVDSSALVISLAAVIGLVALVVIVCAVAKSAKDKRFDGVRTRRRDATAVSPMSGQSVQHSHDRLQGYHGEESGMDHWKKQLDGFLEAGIIDRSEYKVLLERRRR